MLWLWNFFLDRRQFSAVLIGALVIAGSYAILAIPKENSPSIDIPYGFVTTTLPGASAADTETLITNKIENQISGLANVDTITSDSSEGLSVITVQFSASADIDQSIQSLRDAVAKAESDLPADASTPDVSKVNFSDTPIIVASVAGDVPTTEFSALGTNVSDELKKITGVSKVNVSGVPDREVTVIVRKEALAQYGLSLAVVVDAVSAANAPTPAGSISMNGVNYSVNFKGGIKEPAELNDIAVGVKNGVPVYLRDIATIADGFASATTYSRLSVEAAPANQALTFTVYRQSGANIQNVANAVREKLVSLEETTLKGYTVFIPAATDEGVQVTEQLGDLVKTGFETIILVLIALFITIGWRESVVAALSIPLSFLIAFIGLYFTGNTLNFISLFSLILAVGILVDSGIVITEAIHARMRDGSTATAAAKQALHDYAWPLIGGTMATVAVFAPLFFISGIIGKFIAGIPYTIIFVLIASIFVSLGIVPLIAVLFTKKKETSRLEELQEQYTHQVTAWYTRTLRAFLLNRRHQNRFMWGLGGALVLSILLVFTGFVHTVFFPADDQDYVYLNITKQNGTTLAETDLAVREVEELLYEDSNVASFQSIVGQSSSLGGSASSGTHLASITVNLPEKRSKSSSEISAEIVKRLAVVTDADVQVIESASGPSSGAPIQIQFTGDTLDDLITAADSGKQLLASMPQVLNVDSTTAGNGNEFDLTINRAKAAAAGVNAAQVGQLLRAAIQGVTATSITKPDQNLDVVIKLNLNAAYTDPSTTNETTIETIKNLSIPGTNGTVLLGSILEDSLGVSNAAISHEDKQRIETITAYPDTTTTASAVVSTFKARFAEVNLPAGVSVSYGGESEDINTSFTEMFAALLAGLALMFMILVVSFNSIRYTLYLLVIVPLSLIGVLVGLAITSQPLSLTSILGIIALGGVIINHAIILMDSMIRLRAAAPNVPLIDVVVDASATRLRPIVLTTITTVIGMVPLAASNASWGPLAFAVMFGLTFAIILTLILVPTLFFRAPQHTPKP